MWAKVESGSVTNVYTRPTAITIGDVNYPANIMSMWTSSELEAIGIYEVVVDNTNLKSSEYYINGAESFDFAGGVVTKSYATATAINLNDTTVTVGGEDYTNKGLKTQKKETINIEANSLLTRYDWYTLREASGGTATPSAITTYQAAVRTAANSMHTKIDAVSDVDALADLYRYNSDDPPVRPLGAWPDIP